MSFLEFMGLMAVILLSAGVFTGVIILITSVYVHGDRIKKLEWRVRDLIKKQLEADLDKAMNARVKEG